MSCASIRSSNPGYTALELIGFYDEDADRKPTDKVFGSLLADAGTSINAIQRMLGHKNVEATQIYADMSDETKKASVNRITLTPTTTPAPEPDAPISVQVNPAESA